MMKQDSVARIYILTIAFITALWGQVLVVPLLTILATILAAIIRPRWRIRDTEWIICCCGLLFGMLVFRFVVPHAVEQAYWLLPSWLVLSTAECLLLASALELYRYRERGRLPIHFPAWGLGVLICNHHYVATPMHRYLFLLSALLCVFLAAIFFQLNRAERARRYHPHNRGQFSLIGVLLILIGMLAWQSFEVFANTTNPASTWLFDSSGLNDKHKLMYEYNGLLDAVTNLQHHEPDATAIHVQSVQAPGYLRGKVYDRFHGTFWSRVSYDTEVPAMFNASRALPKDVRLAIEESRLAGEELVFALRPELRSPASKDRSNRVESTQAMRIKIDPDRGQRFFTPLDGTYIRGFSPGKSIQLSCDALVTGGLSEKDWYTVFYRDGVTVAPGFTHERYTLAPSNTFSQIASDLSQQICLNAKTPREKIEAVENYCQQNFRLRAWDAPTLLAEAERKLHPARGGGPAATQEELQDYSLAKNLPLTHFMMKNPPATCEYFASAATHLLRHAGVPARYVTGYVVSQHTGNQEWRARNRDAHAWVEAYDEDTQRWVTVEPTPGMKRIHSRANDGARSVGEKLATRPKPKVQIAKVEEKRAYRNVEYWLGKFLGLPMILLLAFAIAISILVVRSLENGLPEEQVWLSFVERRLKKIDLVRKDSETLHQFAHRVEMYPYRDGQSPPPGELATWMKKYADFRYGAKELEPPPGIG